MANNRRPQIMICSLMTSAAMLGYSAALRAEAAAPSKTWTVAQAAQQAPDDTAEEADPTKRDRKRRRHQGQGEDNQPPQGQPSPPVNPAPKAVAPVPPKAPVAQPLPPKAAPPPAPIAKPVPPPAPPANKAVAPRPAQPFAPMYHNKQVEPQPHAKPSHPAFNAIRGTNVKPRQPDVPPRPAHATPPPPAPVKAAPAVEPAVQVPTPPASKPPVKNLQDLQALRQRKVESGGRVVITEPDQRTIIKQNNQVIIKHDETARMRRLDPNARVERGKLGQQTTIIDRPGGAQVVTETDRKGNLIRRYRRDGDGREQVIIDNRKRDKFGRNLAIGLGIVAGAAILNEIVNVPPPRVDIPRDKYVVRGDDASEDDVYEAFNAPPLDRLDRRYSLDQVRATRNLRERMRRVDLDDINFETGSWEVDPSEYSKLERVARAMSRVISRNPNEVFLIEGYTDAVGAADDNLTLSDRRAESVAEVLTREFDVPPENLTTQGYGEQYLKVRTLRAERANRRVALRRITPLIAQDVPAEPRRWRHDRDEDRPRSENRYDDRSDDRYQEPPPPEPDRYREPDGDFRRYDRERN